MTQTVQIQETKLEDKIAQQTEESCRDKAREQYEAAARSQNQATKATAITVFETILTKSVARNMKQSVLEGLTNVKKALFVPEFNEYFKTTTESSLITDQDANAADVERPTILTPTSLTDG